MQLGNFNAHPLTAREMNDLRKESAYNAKIRRARLALDGRLFVDGAPAWYWRDTIENSSTYTGEWWNVDNAFMLRLAKTPGVHHFESRGHRTVEYLGVR